MWAESRACVLFGRTPTGPQVIHTGDCSQLAVVRAAVYTYSTQIPATVPAIGLFKRDAGSTIIVDRADHLLHLTLQPMQLLYVTSLLQAHNHCTYPILKNRSVIGDHTKDGQAVLPWHLVVAGCHAIGQSC